MELHEQMQPKSVLHKKNKARCPSFSGAVSTSLSLDAPGMTTAWWETRSVTKSINNPDLLGRFKGCLLQVKDNMNHSNGDQMLPTYFPAISIYMHLCNMEFMQYAFLNKTMKNHTLSKIKRLWLRKKMITRYWAGECS